MILTIDKPEVSHGESPVVRRINMNDMDAESIEFMIQNSRDDFYSNKELAPIREYSTNARDAHIVAGIPDRPIEITLPSQLAPELKIRDFGKGLSIDEMTDIYFKYWKSTKRNTNLQNGCLGIGAKSALAYAPIYTVVSWHNGMTTVATGQKNGFADIIFNGVNSTNDPEGVEITIPIEQKDINKFIFEALNFFKYWDIRPVFHNIEQDKLTEAFNVMDTKPFLCGNGWAIRPVGYNSGMTKAVMGFVPYSVDWEQVKTSVSPEVSAKIGGIYDFLSSNLTTFYFDNGTLAFTPNRETLQYNELTIKSISEKLIEISDSLLKLISNKISDAPNLWEAKIRYNRIFRKEVEGFDKDETFGGNLQVIENVLKGKVVWNGISIKNGYFEELNSWDSDTVKSGNSYDVSYNPILTVYVKDEDKSGGIVALKTTGRRRWYNENNKIIASPKSIVIIQDTEKNSWAKGLARYFLYKSTTPVSQVYVLELSNPVVRESFIKEYHFETVPVSYVSQNETLIRTYLKSIRAPRSDNGNVRDSHPLNCPFVNIENHERSGYIGNTIWNNESVNARGIEGEGLYYVIYTKDSFLFRNKIINHCESQYFWQSIYELAKLANVPLNKVYGIHPKSANSVWFKEAVEEGNWINLSEFVDENIDVLPKEDIQTLKAYLKADSNRIGSNAATILSPLLTIEDGLATQYFKEIVKMKTVWKLKDISNYLNLDGFEAPDKDIKRFDKLNKEIRKKYPLLFKTNIGSSMFNHHNDILLEKETFKELAEYINMVDSIKPVA